MDELLLEEENEQEENEDHKSISVVDPVVENRESTIPKEENGN